MEGDINTAFGSGETSLQEICGEMSNPWWSTWATRLARNPGNDGFGHIDVFVDGI